METDLEESNLNKIRPNYRVVFLMKYRLVLTPHEFLQI